MSAALKINGEATAFRPASVAELLAGRGLDIGRGALAVAVNGAVVPRRAWAETALAPGDEVEIVSPRSGG